MNTKIIRMDLGGVNCYVLRSEDRYILVDTGGHMVMDKEFTNRCERLEQELDGIGCRAENLSLILLTHGDMDHVCNAAYFRTKYKAKIAMHQDDAYLVEHLSKEDFMDSFQYRSFAFKLVFKLMKKKIEKVAEKTIEDFETFHPDVFIGDNFDLSDYGAEGRILHFPGHTKGSVGILIGNELIAGDTFVNTNAPGLAPNALDFKRLKTSVDKLKGYNIQTIYPGHGEPFSLERLHI